MKRRTDHEAWATLVGLAARKAELERDRDVAFEKLYAFVAKGAAAQAAVEVAIEESGLWMVKEALDIDRQKAEGAALVELAVEHARAKVRR